jgi:Rrf2 family nitric oxide-sensitive transcriptional repressor
MPMRLTLYTDYALRVLIFVGVNRDAISTIDAITEGYGISKNHLRKVVHDLSRHGFIETHQGRKGGIRLGQPPESIKVGAVVRAMEQDRGIVECFDPTAPYCRIQPACALRSILDDALNSFLQTLDRYTLADMIRPRHALADLLAVAIPNAGASGNREGRQRRTGRRRAQAAKS